MICDYHLHSSFSGDSDAAPEDMIQKAITLGMKRMCFTDHYDMDYPKEPELFLFDIDTYFETMQQLKERYRSQITISIGVELGLQEHLYEECRNIVQSYPFDFIIGSSHIVRHMDPYYAEYFEGRSEKDCYMEYFQSILNHLACFNDFDVYGHIDYIVRYGPNKNRNYSYRAYQDVLDDILRACIERGIGLEMNTGGIAYGLGTTNPHPDIIKRYHELGGEVITVGSDAHAPERLGYAFPHAKELLLDCGFKYYTVFEHRKPVFLPLS